MGKMKADATTFGTSSQSDQICRTLVEVLRTAGPEGIPVKELSHRYLHSGRGLFQFPNGKGINQLKEACKHEPYCNYFIVRRIDGLDIIQLKPGLIGGGMTSSQAMPQSEGGGASCPSPRIVVTRHPSVSPSPPSLPVPPPSTGKSPPSLPVSPPSTGKRPPSLPVPPPSTGNTLVVDGPAAYPSLDRMLTEDGRPPLMALAISRRTGHLLLVYSPPSSPPRVVTVHEGAVAGAIEQTPLGGLLRDCTLIKATHDIYAGLGSSTPVLSTAAGVVDTQLLGELLGHPRDVSLRELLAEAQQQTADGEEEKQQLEKTYTGPRGKARSDAEAELLSAVKELLHAFPTLCTRLDPEQRKTLARATYTRQLKAKTVGADGLRPVVCVPSTGRLGSAELWEAVATSKPLMVQDVEPLLKLIPRELIEDMASTSENASTLKEIVLDKGQRPRAKLINSREKRYLHSDPRVVVTSDHLDAMLGPLKIGHDDRTGIDGTLHRISVIKNREDGYTGATLRVGRHVTGNIDFLRDLLTDDPRGLDSILFLGVPGTGKTTLIREVARVLSEDLSIEVLIIDTSNEIAGDGDVAHRSVGASRRMMVQSLDKQASVMIRGLQNHTPEVMIIDEIGRKAEAVAASTVKERGVAVIGSAHGDFESLFRNNELRELLGGSVTVTLGDATAKDTNGGNKIQTRRARDPVFDVIIELKPDQLNEWVVYRDVKAAVDAIYDRRPIRFERRVRDPATGQLSVAYGERMYKSMFDDESQ